MNDRYLKAVLTVIACALVAIAAEGAIPSARAQISRLQKVQICDDLHCANVDPIIVKGEGMRTVVEWGLSVAPEK